MRRLISFLITPMLLASGFAYADHADDPTKAVVRAGVSAAFEEAEKQIIYRYFKDYVKETDHHDHDYDHDYDKHKSKYKKNKKEKGLPPGIAKNLERGKPLPPGIAKRYLPDDLEHQLPPAPHGYERRIVDDDVLLVEVDTGRIADILTDVLLGE